MKPGSAARLGVLALLWGSSFLWISVALDGLSPAQLTFARLALGAGLLLALVRLRGLRLPRDRGTWGALSVAALGANAVPYTLFGIGQQSVDSAVAGAINATTPLWTSAVAFAAGGLAARPDAGTERGPGGRRAAGLLLGFAGAVLLLAPWQAGEEAGDLGGSLACLAAAASYGLSYIWIGRRLVGRGIPPLVASAAQLLVATALLVPALAVEPRAPDLDPAVLGATAALGLGGTGLAYVLNYRLIADEGPTAASTVTYLIPLVAVTLGVAVLDEPLGWSLAAGTVAVLAGVALAQRPREPGRP